jgi:predicted amidophosphoribosyltransferase
LAIKQVLANNHRKECPYCMEIIKSQARVCKHCGKDV